jgi:hypothetical protein
MGEDMTTTETMPRSWSASNVAIAILAGGFAAATLDIIFASTYAGAMPDRVFKYIASGWVTLPVARGGGIGMVLLGAASHYFIAFCAAAVYVLASRPLPMLRRQYIAFGVAYGAALHCFMNFVVVPLSAIHRAFPEILTQNFIINLIAQMLLFGLPIAYFARRYLGRD